MTDAKAPRVVTIGGGHGQAALLASLRLLECDVTAIVSVADDGGCSGQLRKEVGMPPPGDLRRCLTTLARDAALAERFELRLLGPGEEGRSAGNLALSEAFREFGSLQKAVDWAAGLLQCRGRVVPVAETPGELVVYDRRDGRVEGESEIERASSFPMVVMVHGPTQTNPVAVEFIRRADFILLGPGSFFTSVLATITTADFAEALIEARARKVLIANLVPEGGQTAGFTVDDYVRMLRDHLTIASVGGFAKLAVIEHVPGSDSKRTLADGTPCMGAHVAGPGGEVHDSALLASAISRHLGLQQRVEGSVRPAPSGAGTAAFEERLDAARKLLRSS